MFVLYTIAMITSSGI